MKKLKAKHYNTQSEWMYVWNHYDEIRTKAQIEELIAETVAEIHAVCDGKNAAYAWSGGKDSIALQIVCEDAGIKKGFCAYNPLYFSESINFFITHKPDGIVLYDSGEDVNWLAEHPAFLFPKGGSLRWNVRTHLKYQPIYCKENNIDILMMGKRSQDGNVVAKELVHTSPQGVNIYCPIRKWTHEDVICAIRYRGKELSPIYFTEEGFHYGDTKFAVMSPFKGESVSTAWHRIYKIEPQKVFDSATAGIPSAIQYLKERFSGQWT